MARNGKIARLPIAVREQLNQRLQNGEMAAQILPWLNALPETRQALAQFGERDVNDANLSAWRTGGFVDWEEKQSRTYKTKELAAYAVKLTAANGGTIAEGAAAIASGRLLELLEAATNDDSPKMTAEDIKEVVAAITSLRSAEIAQQRADQDKEKLRQKDEELKLAREKFQRDTAEAVLKSARDTAVQAIAAAPMDHTAQLDAVGQHLFGELWKPS